MVHSSEEILPDMLKERFGEDLLVLTVEDQFSNFQTQCSAITGSGK